MMIRTASQLENTRRHIQRLRELRAGVGRKHGSERVKRAQTAGYDRVLGDLRFQVRAYEDAERGRVRPEVLKELLTGSCRPRIGEAIFLLRKAKGLTQKGLARKLGTRREVVARWERDDYQEYTFENLKRIFEALGCRLDLYARVAG